MSLLPSVAAISGGRSAVSSGLAALKIDVQAANQLVDALSASVASGAQALNSSGRGSLVNKLV